MKLTSIPIRLERCSKTFNGNIVLQPLDLQIGAGETLVLLGPSGCGKTTTLRLIAGLERPDAGGRVLFGDDDVTRLAIEDRRVGMVFQNYALFPNFTVRGNVAYGLKLRRLPAAQIKRRVDELLDMVQLTALADRPIAQLSGGQKQRVALARALAPEPRVLLLDEPLTALDAKLRETVRADMDKLLRDLGVTTVYVTHDQDEAMALGDRIVVMSAGRIEQIGTPRDIYYHPCSRHVANFVGTLNRLSGDWRDGAFHMDGGALDYPGGDTATRELFFRPEDAIVGAADGAALAGTVDAVQFLGDRTRLSLAGISGAGPVLVEVSSRTSYERGQRVGLTLASQAVFPLNG
ncbi:ABC transporter ATP-binding protein [Bordetella genomosp. 11]|uniref:ABC transporter ATP-binding protein n=1 Tax=Bordetella genomosp. 11 TaxID=1416808 RepID=A0A261ULS7_9BORD|nr:ABC transporter ATP-binding protein [Bordetella genomosp. 11]OZI61863.1 ABC transporter ATP-binding protein [Bordetella genomosp. 11]